MSDKVSKQVDLKSPVSRVWKALTDSREFGEWFRVKLEGPFVVGQVVEGQITYPGYEHIRFQALVQKMEPERYFAYSWPHYDGDVLDIKRGPSTLVEFTLEAITGGTRLTMTESGFEKLPPDKRMTAMRENEGGWVIQCQNIETYLAQKP